MIIGFDAKRAFNNNTGLGNYSRTLLNGLVETYPLNQYFLFATSETNIFPHRSSNTTVVIPQQFLHKILKWYWRSFYLIQEQSKNGLNIYHGLSNELPFGKPPPAVKQVVTIHDLIFLKYPQFYPLIDRTIYQMKVRHSCKVADCIIAVSQQTKRDLAEWLPFTKEKIKVVYQSSDPAFEKDITTEKLKQIKNKFSLPDKYILYVGAISERKNLLKLTRAFGLIADKLKIELIMVGEGKAYKKKLERLIQSLGLADRAHIVSDVETDDLAAIYRMAQLFVYPSVYEGFGIPIIEALFSEIPVITSNGGCFPEAGGPHSCYADTSDVYDLSHKIYEVLTNESLRKTMITNGTEYVKRFKSEEVSKKMMEVYENLQMP